MIDAVIFDMDGVLVDSEPLWKRAMIEVWATIGLDISVEDCRATQGLRIDEVVDVWYEREPWTQRSPAEVVQATVARVVELIHEEGELLPGVVDALELFATRSVPMAVASSSDLVLIDAVVHAFDLGGVFSALVSAEHEDFGKPHPAVYLTAANEVEADPSRCLAIEDSLNGIVAAKAARMHVLAVPDPAFRGDARLALADAMIDSLTELTPALWDRLNGMSP